MDGKKPKTKAKANLKSEISNLKPFFEDEWVTLYVGDVRTILPQLGAEVAQSCITSPPYFGLRDYSTATWKGGKAECDHVQTFRPQRNHNGKEFGTGRGGENSKEASKVGYRQLCGKCGAVRVDSQIGLETSPAEFTRTMVDVFEDVKRRLKKDGTLWLNLGDSFASNAGGYDVNGSRGATSHPTISRKTQAAVIQNRSRLPMDGYKPKDLMMIPATVAMALRDAGWWLRQAFPWVKRSAMPESVDSRAANALEYVFHLQRSADCFYDADAVRKGQMPATTKRLAQDIDNQNGSSRAYGGNRHNGPMKAHVPGNKTHRGADAYENGDERHRTKGGLVTYSQKQRDRSLPTNRNGITDHLDNTPAGSRNFRNADLWFESTETPHGLTFVGDQIVGIDCNPTGFSAEFCTACERYYHDAKDKKEITREKIGDKTISHCICGRTDAWLSHFATFPKKFVEPFIKCSTSEAGECSVCGKALVRVTETEYVKSPVHGDGSQMRNRAETSDINGWAEGMPRVARRDITMGWQLQCECDADTQPQTVFEPFSGAGTTFIVAAKLGRRCIAVELNENYARMSVERYKREMRHEVDPPRRVEAMPLFAVMGGK